MIDRLEPEALRELASTSESPIAVGPTSPA